jgi:glycerol uptake facilitator-like aquaporin
MQLAGIFAGYPKSQLSIGSALWDSMMATMFLVIMVHAISDQRQEQNTIPMNSILIGLVLTIIPLGYGYNDGGAINPARDLAPRLFTLIAGWGSETFTTSTFHIHNFWWIPVVGPMLGAIFATILYDFCIANHWPEL